MKMEIVLNRSARLAILFWLLVGMMGCAAMCGNTEAADSKTDKLLAEELQKREKARELSRSHYREGYRQFEHGHYDDAQSSFRKAVEQDDRNAHAWMGLGAAWLKLNQWFEAAQAFDRAARLMPGRYEPRFNLGLVYEGAGRYSDAIDEYETSLQMSPGQIEVMENLARLYLRTEQNPDRAQSLLEQSLKGEHRPEWREWIKRQMTIKDEGVQAPKSD